MATIKREVYPEVKAVFKGDKVEVTMVQPEKINARLMARLVRELTKTRKLALKSMIEKARGVIRDG